MILSLLRLVVIVMKKRMKKLARMIEMHACIIIQNIGANEHLSIAAGSRDRDYSSCTRTSILRAKSA